MDKLERLKSVLDIISKNKSVSKESICKQANISEITLKRYLSELRILGYAIKSRGGLLSLEKIGIKPKKKLFTKEAYKDFQLLTVIYNCKECTREYLKQFYCNDSVKVKAITGKTLDLHLSRLVEQGLIVKHRDTRGRVSFTPTDALILDNCFDTRKIVMLINYLKIYKDTLPYKEKIEVIIEKLEIACLNYIRKSIEVREDVQFTKMVFPDCVMEELGQKDELLAGILEEYCLNGRALKIKMKHGSIQKIFPFLVVFNWDIGCWYLVCRHITDDSGFDLLRLDRMASIEQLAIEPRSNVEAEISSAREEIGEAFEVSTEENIPVEVIFRGISDDELEEIENRMKQCNFIIRKELENNTYLYKFDVKGTYDFLSWLRRFGSKALLLDRELRQLHIDEAKEGLKKYII